MGFLISMVVLSFLIFFHELGHFLVARLFKVKVEVFSIGFGSTILKKVVGDTEYRLSLIPLGGYVKMKGQDDLEPTSSSNDSDSYNSKTPLQRIGILLGGPLFNFILAFILFIAISFIGFKTLSPTIGNLQADMPAVESGLKNGDLILSINSEKIQSWKELSKEIKKSTNNIVFHVQRGDETINVSVTPKIVEAKNIFGETVLQKMVGISPNGDIVNYKLPFYKSIIYGYEETISSTTLIFKSVEKLIVGVLALDQLGGVVSIFEVTAKASETGLTALIFMVALLSVNLGVLNLLPIPALDGGHIIFNLYELIRGRSPNEKVMYGLTIAGWFILLSLMSIGLFNDINRLVAG